jgi:transposase
MARHDSSRVNIGIDVGETQLDVCIHETQQFVSFANSAKGIRQLVVLLDMFAIERIVIEATGRLERPFVDAALERVLRSSSCSR